jgi:hypothetical protein
MYQNRWTIVANDTGLMHHGECKRKAEHARGLWDQCKGPIAFTGEQRDLK